MTTANSAFPELDSPDVRAGKFPAWMDAVRFNADGLVMAICQDATAHDNLMVAWMDKAALYLTISRGEMVFWSRSRKEYWHKGATSGNVLTVKEFRVDCDGDVLQFKVAMQGVSAACHTGRRSCFYRRLDVATGQWVTDSEPLFDPKVIYGK